MYCDEVQLEADTVLATLYVAKKYIVPHLARACVNYLETSLTAKNACLLLSQSRLFEEPDLMQRCWEVIDAQVSPSLKQNTNPFGNYHSDNNECTLYRTLSWNSNEESNSENNQLQRWQGQEFVDETLGSSCSDFRKLSNKFLFASYPLSLSESNCFLFDVKLNNTSSKTYFSLNRTRSEPYFLDNSKLGIEITQNITYNDSFTDEYKDIENNFDIDTYALKMMKKNNNIRNTQN